MTDHKPFGELSDAEKGALLLAHREGKRIEIGFKVGGSWIWRYAIKPRWYVEARYRVAERPS